MAGEKYADKAVAKLVAWFEAQLQTYLTAVETAQSLTSGTMTPPVDYLPAMLPDDVRSPILMVYCADGSTEDINNGLYVYDCTVALAFTGDADLEAGQIKARRYLTALVDTLRADRTLGGTVAHAIETDQSMFHDDGADSLCRNAVAIGVSVMLYEPT